jgi:mono/diheme cytochrome c family protein
MRTLIRHACIAVTTLCGLAVGASTTVAAGFDPAVAFTSRCSGCHSVGHGEVVGPDLRGVLQRHDRSWLHAFIHSSQSVIRAGDSTAQALFQRYGRRTMPDHDLSIPEIDKLLDFIAAGGPTAGAAVRSASQATAAETARGRELFLGIRSFRNGGAACIQCHAAGNATEWGGGTLGLDLTGAYDKYRDWGLDRALTNADFPLMDSIYHRRPLAADEVFAVKAFLYRASRMPRALARSSSPLFLMLGLGSSALMLGLKGRGPKP